MADVKPELSRLGELAAGLRPHQHLCFIYETQEERFASAVPFLGSGLERGEKCLYVADEHNGPALLEALRKTGTDVNRYLRGGALLLATKPYAASDSDPDEWIGVLSQSIEGAGDDRFSGMKTWLGEMTWALAEKTAPETLIEFEAKVNHFIRDHEVKALCLYDRHRFSPEFLLGVIRTHPLVVYGALICENPYYVPPEELLKPDQPSREVDRLLNNMFASQRAFDQLRALAGRLQSVREEERAKVAREIHDELGQALTAIKIDFASLLRDPHQDPALASSPRSQSIVKLLDQAIQSVRRIGTELRPGILDDMGLAAALEWAAEDFQTRTGTRCEISLPDVDLRLEAERATALLRIFQETLTNIARHADATQVQVRFAKENDNLILEVRDNGKGMREDQLSGKSSLGILGMRERVLLLGGTLTISSTLGSGTTVRVQVPNSTPSAE